MRCHPPHALPVPPSLPNCRSIERSNLFEQLCGLLSKTAFPVSGPLAAVHLQSLDGILAILSALAAPCSGVSDLGGWGSGCVWVGGDRWEREASKGAWGGSFFRHCDGWPLHLEVISDACMCAYPVALDVLEGGT
jgi:hypothetical protein